MESTFIYYKNRFCNIFYLFYIILKSGIYYLYEKDSINFLQNITAQLETFNYTYIKIFQSMSYNSNIFNDEQKNFLVKYTNKVPFQISAADLDFLTVLEEKYSNKLKIFKENPINSGIIAVVYKGYLLDNNEPIVIKVLKKDVTYLLNSAFSDINFISKFIGCIPFLSKFMINDMLNFNRDIIINQLNFSKELENLKMWKKYSNRVEYFTVPNYYEEYTKDYNNILVMEYLESKSIDDIPSELYIKYLENLYKSIIIGFIFYGIVHGDLHSGNILLMENNKIGLIDFGMSSIIDKNENETIFKILKIYIDNEFDILAWCDDYDINNLLETLLINEQEYNFNKIKKQEIINEIKACLIKNFIKDKIDKDKIDKDKIDKDKIDKDKIDKDTINKDKIDSDTIDSDTIIGSGVVIPAILDILDIFSKYNLKYPKSLANLIPSCFTCINYSDFLNKGNYNVDLKFKFELFGKILKEIIEECNTLLN